MTVKFQCRADGPSGTPRYGGCPWTDAPRPQKKSKENYLKTRREKPMVGMHDEVSGSRGKTVLVRLSALRPAGLPCTGIVVTDIVGQPPVPTVLAEPGPPLPSAFCIPPHTVSSQSNNEDRGQEVISLRSPVSHGAINQLYPLR